MKIVNQNKILWTNLFKLENKLKKICKLCDNINTKKVAGTYKS